MLLTLGYVLDHLLYVTVAWECPLFLLGLGLYHTVFLLVGAEASAGRWPQPR